MEPNLDFRNRTEVRLLRALVEAHRWVLDADSRRIAEYGLGHSEFDCLVTLGVHGPLKMGELAGRSLLTKSRTTQVVKQLRERGFVDRARSCECEREVIAELTETGTELFRKVYPPHVDWLGSLFEGRLEESQQEDLIRLLRLLSV